MTIEEKRKIVEGIAESLMFAIGKETLDLLKENGFGVTLFAFSFEPGALAYISTSNREDMLRAIKEWVAHQEAGLTADPRGERPRT